MPNDKVWYVTGASQGLGLTLVKQLLAAGYRVAAISRSVAGLQQAVGSAEGFLALEVDLSSARSIEESLSRTVAHFGSVDVIVNKCWRSTCRSLGSG
jgi:NAD(P)-dependent dehydrogenase (short-subunit alcohol dehydrogenase family)